MYTQPLTRCPRQKIPRSGKVERLGDECGVTSYSVYSRSCVSGTGEEVLNPNAGYAFEPAIKREEGTERKESEYETER